VASFFRRILLGAGRQHALRGGIVFSAAIVLVGLGAVISANNLLFLIVAGMLAAMLASGFLSRMGLAGLELDFVAPDHIWARRTASAALRVVNRKWMPSFSIRVAPVASGGATVYFPVVAGGSTVEERVELLFERRGAYKHNRFLFTTSFPFGFVERTAQVELRRELIVYPSVDLAEEFGRLCAQVEGELEFHERGRGSDFHRIRPYETFESARHLDWKASARTNELQVREFTREPECAVEIYLDREAPARAEGFEAWFEGAVECAAGLAWRLAESGGALWFRSQGFEARLPAEGGIHTILKFLALAGPIEKKPLDEPADGSHFQIVFSARPAKLLEEAGWTPAHVVGVRDIPAADRGAGGGPGDEARAGVRA
jgi:uncharacterized protein (DUF58 family)